MIVMSIIISSKDDRMYGKIMTIKIKTIEIIELVDILKSHLNNLKY